MGQSIIFFAIFSVLLCTAVSLQIRKTLKLEGDPVSKSVGDKPNVDGEREEVYDFFDQRYGQDAEYVRKKDYSEQPGRGVFDVTPNLEIGFDHEDSANYGDVDWGVIRPRVLMLRAVNLAEGITVGERRPWDGENYGDIFGQGLSTASPSSGAEVSFVRNGLGSEAEGTVKLFLKDEDSNYTCSAVDATKRVNAHCGNHYLFPGYSMRLVSSEHCSWSFRHLSPEIIFALKGMQLEKDLVYEVEEKLVTSSVKMAIDGDGKRKLLPTFKLLRELIVTTPKVDKPGYVNAEVCAPSVSMESEYLDFEPTCCSKNNFCGVPVVKDPVGHKLTMHALPWEAVLTIRGTATSDEDDTWCAGSLISTEWVLTTAACFIRNGVLGNSNGYVPEVIVAFGLSQGKHHVDALPVDANAVQTHAVAEVHVFPTVTETHDIALVRLKKASSRMPVCLPAYERPDPARNLYNREAVVFGWVVDDGAPYMSALKQNVISSDMCSTKLGKSLPPHMVCSVDTREDRPCLADGDLLTVVNNRYYLSGLTWHRLRCGDDFRPHTSVAYFMNWISSVAGIPMESQP